MKEKIQQLITKLKEEKASTEKTMGENIRSNNEYALSLADRANRISLFIHELEEILNLNIADVSNQRELFVSIFDFICEHGDIDSNFTTDEMAEIWINRNK